MVLTKLIRPKDPYETRAAKLLNSTTEGGGGAGAREELCSRGVQQLGCNNNRSAKVRLREVWVYPAYLFLVATNTLA
jgi:hypothetical protein